jgi:hypothetical protein
MLPAVLPEAVRAELRQRPNGHFYCSHGCAEIGGKLGLGHVEDLATKARKRA